MGNARLGWFRLDLFCRLLLPPPSYSSRLRERGRGEEKERKERLLKPEAVTLPKSACHVSDIPLRIPEVRNIGDCWEKLTIKRR